MSLEAWQTALRRQFGPEQPFLLKNTGGHPLFSEFEVTNSQSRNTYRVAIRGSEPGNNFCSCPDFATNTLGTCKHIEFTLARLGRKPANRHALARGFEPPFSEVYLHYGAQRQVRFRPRAAAPAELTRLAARYFDGGGTLRAEAFAQFETFLSTAVRLDPDLRCYEDALGFVAQVRDAERRDKVVTEAFPRGIRSAAFKNLLRVPLYDYQRVSALFASRAGRCLIADDMGLGKTIEAIAAVEIMARHFGVERVLVVCPTSLKHQWEREIARVIDRLARVIGGFRRGREEGFRAASFYKITNYDTVYRDLDLIAAWSPDLVILDEAQRIKNWNTRTARSVKKIASPYALVLTGTPLENRLEELLSIVQFVDQHRLGPTFRFLHDHQILDEFGKVVGYRNLDSIGKTLAPVLIRRRKEDVLHQLPERLEKRFFVPMTPQQMDHHEENREIVGKLVAKWRRFRFLSEADQRRLLIALQNMRMACDSTYLLDQRTDHGVKADELATLLEEIFESPDTKAVIFSQWLRMHEVLVRRLERRKWSHVLFHGGVESVKRKALIDRFCEDPRCRAFLSTDAGGVGLNLQHATVVVNVDLPWNPAVLEQRIGRVHRLGQTRPVQVVSFVAKGTIEEGMLSVLGFKRSLFAGILDGGESEVFLGGSRLKRFMESVENVTAGIPAPIVEEAAEPAAAEERVDGDSDAAVPSAAPRPAADPLSSLVRTGLDLLAEWAAAGTGQAATAATPSRLFERIRDERSGQSYLKIRMPEPEVVDRVAQALQALLESLKP
ncbi:MAG: DEAD/DEAH box helicase [Candidatus Rokubacteria bacterium]|nr:DEAD/DEAH box helicase [Candidatus Rokubacteria bacterium]